MAALSMTFARPYAKAAFESALKQDNLASWSDMLALAASLAREPDMQVLMASPSMTAAEKGAAFSEVCGDQIDERFSNLLGVLAINGRLSLLPEICDQYEILRSQREQKVEVLISTAFPVSDAVTDNLAQALGRHLDSEVSLTSVVDESLLGGALIRAGNLVIDGSLRGRLERLAESVHS